VTRWALWITLGLACGACGNTARCQRQVHAAYRQALWDVETCQFDPDALLDQECAGNDFQSRNTYLAVFCAQAAPNCLEGEDEVWNACFGEPES